MTISLSPTITLDEFLKLPDLETSPAWEYMNGVAIQKPMAKMRHSLLQKRLISIIDNNSENHTALPELRCTFGGRSIVPDIAVINWNKLPINELGEVEDNFTLAPDWSIEILSPNQAVTRVMDNLLHCLKHGCQLGWMIDPDDASIVVFSPQQEPDIYRGDRSLPLIDSININLTPKQVFNWLKINNK
ncbi:Uma2 family endonuclease [Crocosphaera sp.]|uniref:Uma2 family endonuclease n=1 Tax=Crocosphaera sp. TaxID=2729996 RepID=UPI003F298C53|nr:Uma2 family endonuclease [Crocosphaera sp.]